MIAACSTDGGSSDWGQAAKPDNGQFRWVGEGEPGNFASAYNFCASTLGVATQGERYLGDNGAATSIPGAPTQVPGVYRNGPAQTTYTNQRQFWGCMQGQGWAYTGQQPQMAQPQMPL